ncbi:acanthoscurrin-2-like [Ylistrum balloti]|uniref:acanthoscurrin-2-like n=1 Tax=Ylistrum balloti TaxID=509963 RepID=UPI002905CEA2|nr:acanthoscurrin-2-like [Ylistrum balloti]
MQSSRLNILFIVFALLHIARGFIFGPDLFGGGLMATDTGAGSMGGMGGLMGGAMDGSAGFAMGGTEGVFGSGMGMTGGGMGGMDSFFGSGTGGTGGTMGGFEGMMGLGMGGAGNAMGGMESLFGGPMGAEMGGMGGMGSLLSGGMGTNMGGTGMASMFGQLGQGQKKPVTKKCMSPMWLKYCKCHFMCPRGHVSYGNCEDYKENSFLPTMCCPESVHYACVGFEF